MINRLYALVSEPTTIITRKKLQEMRYIAKQ